MREAIQENKEFIDKLNNEKFQLENRCRELQEQANIKNNENYTLIQQNQKLRQEKKKMQEEHRVILTKTRADLRDALDDKKVIIKPITLK